MPTEDVKSLDTRLPEVFRPWTARPDYVCSRFCCGLLTPGDIPVVVSTSGKMADYDFHPMCGPVPRHRFVCTLPTWLLGRLSRETKMNADSIRLPFGDAYSHPGSASHIFLFFKLSRPLRVLTNYRSPGHRLPWLPFQWRDVNRSGTSFAI